MGGTGSVGIPFVAGTVMGELVALRSARLARGLTGLVAVEEEGLTGWCRAALATPAAALYNPLVVAHRVLLVLVLVLLL